MKNTNPTDHRDPNTQPLRDSAIGEGADRCHEEPETGGAPSSVQRADGIAASVGAEQQRHRQRREPVELLADRRCVDEHR